MTRNCLNVMRKVAADFQALQNAGIGAGNGMLAQPAVGSVHHQINQQQRPANYMNYLSNSPIATHFRNAARTAYNGLMHGVPGMTQMVAPTSQRMSNAPTGAELYKAQQQVDARRAQSGLPSVDNRYNGPLAALRYDPKTRSLFMSLLAKPTLPGLLSSRLNSQPSPNGK